MRDSWPSEYFQHVTIPRVSEFKACNFCSKIKERQIHHRMDVQEKLQLQRDQERMSISV